MTLPRSRTGFFPACFIVSISDALGSCREARHIIGGGINQINAGNKLVAANVCSADDEDATCYSKREEGIANGIHMLKDDYPYPVADREYWMEWAMGLWLRVIWLTAPPNCTGEAMKPKHDT